MISAASKLAAPVLVPVRVYKAFFDRVNLFPKVDLPLNEKR